MIKLNKVISWRLSVISLLILSGCGSDHQSGSASALGSGGEIKAEAFCSVPELAETLRHTYLLLDEAAISKTTTPAEFVDLNAPLRDMVLTFADPKKSLSAGTAAARERVSIFVLPRDGSAGKRVFTGCIPGLSSQELKTVKSESSKISDFFSGGIAQKIENDSKAFRTRLIGGLQVAAAQATGPAEPHSGGLDETSLVKSLRASGRMINGDEGPPRVILYTDISKLDLPTGASRQEARQAGFDLARGTSLDFGRSNVAVVLPSSTNEITREFFDTFLLAQHGHLIHWGSASVGALPPAPTQLQRYAGEVEYSGGSETVQLRIGTDQDGKLVNSWLVQVGSPNRSTPLTGQAICDDTGSCEIRSDDGGFTQAWSLSPGGEAEFDPEAPFGGLRQFRFETNEEQLTGKFFDPVVGQIGDADHIPVSATVQKKATF